MKYTALNVLIIRVDNKMTFVYSAIYVYATQWSIWYTGALVNYFIELISLR